MNRYNVCIAITTISTLSILALTYWVYRGFVPKVKARTYNYEDIETESIESTESIGSAESTTESDIQEHESEGCVNDNLETPIDFASQVKRVSFRDNLSTDDTLFLTITLEIYSEKNSNNLTKRLIDQIKDYFENAHRFSKDFENLVPSKKFEQEHISHDDTSKTIDVSDFSELIKRFYEELKSTLIKANENPTLYYPNNHIQNLNDLKFYPVWNGLRKCILIANTPYSKKDGFKTVERIVVTLEAV